MIKVFQGNRLYKRLLKNGTSTYKVEFLSLLNRKDVENQDVPKSCLIHYEYYNHPHLEEMIQVSKFCLEKVLVGVSVLVFIT